MAEPAAAQVAADEAGGRRRSGSYWIEGRDGKLPWSLRRVVLLVALPLLALLIGVATPWAILHIEDTLENETRADLAAAGIDPSGLRIDFDYRSGTALGTLPSGVSAEQAEASVEHGLLRELTVVAEAPAGDGVATEAPQAVDASGAAEPASPAEGGEAAGAGDASIEAGPTEVTAQLINGELVITGVVLTEAQRASLVDAGIAAVGEERVRDELEVSGLAAAVEGADERIAAMAQVIGTLGEASRATLALTDTSLDVTATAAGPDAATAMQDAATQSPVGGAVAIDVGQGSVQVDVRLRRGTVILRGTVLSEAQRTELVEAATALVGAERVDDRLEVSGLAEARSGADERVSALAGLIGELGNATAATAALSDARLRLSATTRTRAAATSIVAAGDAITAVEARVSARRRAPSAPAQITGLQAELDGLAAEIRETVVFESGESELSPDAQATLDKVVAAMVAFPRPVVEVSGHTDDVGDAVGNQELSADRAAAVVAYLEAAGVESARLRSRGAGAAEPIADNSTSEGRAQNRRVEFTASESFG